MSSDSNDPRLAKYETLVYPCNRHSGYGVPVTVYAENVSEAKERAILIGWAGYPDEARVFIKCVHDVEVKTT